MNVIAWSENLKFATARDNQVLAVTKGNYEVFYTQIFENLKSFAEEKPIRVIQILN